MADEWEETGSSGPYPILQQGEDALKDIQQNEFRNTDTRETKVFYKYDYQSWGEAIEEGQTRD